MSSKRSARVTKSCFECQRRKQKCSREWPCNHCRTRRISHLCSFGTAASRLQADGTQSGVSFEAEAIPEQFDSGQKIMQGSEDIGEQLVGQIEASEELYRTSLYDVSLRSAGLHDNLQQEAMRELLEICPPRTILDFVVQDFITNSNYQYCIVHPTVFLEHYVQWWHAKEHDLRLDPRFTCLLMRVCSYALLYLSPATQQYVEAELSAALTVLTERYHEAAQRLSMTISPGRGGLMQVQQLFLTSCWLKAQALFIDAWHALGAAVREAQELGMHKLPPPNRFSDFELEARARVWWILYSWDWQMSRGVSRPLLIDQDNCIVREPNLYFDEVDSAPGKPSSFTHMALLGDLVQNLARRFDKLDHELDGDQVNDYLKQVEDWFEMLPSCYRHRSPDMTWDQSHPYIVNQRWQMNVGGYLIKLLPLKPYLRRAYTIKSSMEDLALRAKAIKCCLEIIDVSHSKLTDLLPRVPKQNVATFGIFDTAGFLCSAVMHDQLASLPQSARVFDAVRQSVSTMEWLGTSTSLGSKPFQILKTLAQGVSIIPTDVLDNAPVPKRTRTGDLDDSGPSYAIDQIQEISGLADLSSQGAEWQLWQDAIHGTFEFDEHFDIEAFFSSEP